MEYVLRPRDNDELKRLQFQHEVWKEETDLALHYASIKLGDRVMDLGCGPGSLAFDLLEKVGPDGLVCCVDSSEKFLDHISEDEAPNIETRLMDIRHDLERELKGIERFDCVVSRWVLMFTGHTDKIIQNVYDLLQPGGRFVSMEYFNFRHISLKPESPAFVQLYQNVWKLLTDSGGNPDVGGVLQESMHKSGFDSVRQISVFRADHPGSDLWKWMTMNNENHTNLVEAGLIDQALLDTYLKEWDERSNDPRSILTAPPLMITIGEKA